jgi:biotin synthase
MLNTILNKIGTAEELSPSDLSFLLSLNRKDETELLFKKAYKVKKYVSGNNTFIRGLIELSNICSRDCYYCGIRKSNSSYKRYTLKLDEVIHYIKYADSNNYSSIVIQAGERQDKEFINYITEILKVTKKISNGKLRVTLSLGEQSEETYKKWFDAGAHRYLLRIETTNPALFSRIHPDSYSFESRVKCLKTMKKIGYQLGTGVLIGFPGQTIEDLVKDILFFKKLDVDMIGMGPYIPHKDTPLGKGISNNFNEIEKQNALLLGLKMIAVTRLYLNDINIASTTALESLSSNGLEQGLLAGANVFMINMTDYNYKKSYLLYDNKPCYETDITTFQKKVNSRIENIGEKIAFGIHGDSAHFRKH